ncbi:MAG: hypothetical protein J2P29_13900 [Actinobacteria bacterium]|nr:hypothetical protein [Actinomycetota bacterium]
MPRAVGTYGPLDVARSGRRLPPDPQESLVDVAAVQHGESRVVVCFLSRRPSRWSPGPRIGVLEIRPGGATWRPWPSLGRRPCSLGVTAVLVVQPAGWVDIRLTGPGNFHLFTVVRCATAAGRIDLIVPTADVPLVTWRLAGEQAMPSDLARAARRPPPPPGASMRRALGAVVAVAVGSLLAFSGPRFLADVAFVWSGLLLGSALTAHLRRRLDRRG